MTSEGKSANTDSFPSPPLAALTSAFPDSQPRRAGSLEATYWHVSAYSLGGKEGHLVWTDSFSVSMLWSPCARHWAPKKQKRPLLSQRADNMKGWWKSMCRRRAVSSLSSVASNSLWPWAGHLTSLSLSPHTQRRRSRGCWQQRCSSDGLWSYLTHSCLLSLLPLDGGESFEIA